MKILLALAGFAAVTLPVAQAAAQVAGNVRVRAGLGAQVRPEFPGANDLEWALYPKVSVARGDQPFGFSAPDDSFDLSLLSNGGFRAGPVLEIAQGRKNSEVGYPVGKVPSTVEVGAFVQQDVSDSFRLRAELRKGLGGHGGLVGQAGADYVWREGDKYLFSVGPRLLFSDGDYHRSYFGVRPEASVALALPPYQPDAGIHAIAATSGMHYALGGGWGLFGYARYERLVGDARKSPIVREFGSPNQFSAGLGINHTFNLKL